VALTTCLGREQPDVTAIGERGEGVDESIDKVAVAVPPPQQNDIHDIVVILVD